MSADIWVTIPTAGRSTLTAAIDSTGIPRERIVLVLTSPDVTIPTGCLFDFDIGPVNIHRWWNRGIDTAVARGARYVAVLNDDVLMDEHTLPALLERMDGATIASPGGGGVITTPDPARAMVLNGACWLLDTSHGIRPDESYRWWYGDNDLDLRARRDGHGVASVQCYFEHLHPSVLTDSRPELTELARLDALLWTKRLEG